MRRAVAVAALAVATAAALFLPAQTAQAATSLNPTPNSLPSCASQATLDGLTATSGGWDQRQVSAQGSDDVTFAGQFRPRNLRLGEVCVGNGTLGTAGQVVFPFMVTDSPTQDTTYSAAIPPGWDRVCGGGSFSNICIQYLGPTTISGTPYVCFKTTTAAGANVSGNVSFPADIRWSGGTIFNGGSTTSRQNGAFFEAPCQTAFGLSLNVTSVAAFTSGGHTPTAYAVGSNCISGTPSSCGPIAGNSPGAGSLVGATYGSPMLVGGDLAGNAKLRCSTSSTATTGTTDRSLAFNFRINQDFAPTWDAGHTTPSWKNSDTYSTGFTAASCPFIVSLSVTVCSWDQDHQSICTLLTWVGFRFTEQTTYTDDDPSVEMCKQHPSWQGCVGVVEPAISCQIDYTDPGDPFTVIGDFFSGLPEWVGCMVIPQGWDRAGKLAKALNAGPLLSISNAVPNILPSSLACGSVGTIPGLTGTISLDTCVMDVMPSGAKNVVGYVLVLGVAGFAIKRILWAVGGDSAPLVQVKRDS